MRRLACFFALGALFVPAVALASGWRIIGQGKASGRLTIAAASGVAMRPTAIEMKVTASPNIRTVAGYSIRCRNGSRKGRGTGTTTTRTPIVKAMPLPITHPATCSVVASATLPATTKLTVTILAR
jgi:hypothetical protein